MSTQTLLSHLPALFVKQPDEALLVGLGSGVSLGSLLEHPVKHVDVLEISREVVEASNCFREYNHNALDDPRVNIVVADGRHHLERTRQSYDLIISQPSNPWITGVANLFTREYYRLMSDHLTDGGVACQWLPSYNMSKEMLGVVCKTFSEVFPNASLWTSAVVGDLFLIGSNRGLELDYRLLCERLAEPGINQDLARIGMSAPTMLAMTFKYGPEGIQGLLAGFAQELPLNTDVYPVLEFESPRYLLTQRVARDFRSRGDLAGNLPQLLRLMKFADEQTREDFMREAHPLMPQAPNMTAAINR